MTKRKDLDAYERPPVFLKSTYKSYQRISLSALDQDAKILDLSGASDHGLQKSVIDTGIISQSAIRAACHYLHDEGALEGALDSDSFCQDVQIYEAQDIPDIAAFIHGLFPEMKPEAAIVNVYTPGDTLSLHRDVSEECENGLMRD
ncbi:hypothetical protein P7C71_g5423, partial [Lecanoromycetidae sp. Uapishka_2]